MISIDLGSNSLRVLKYDCITQKILDEFDKTVGTADGLIQTGNISNEAVKRVVDALNESIIKIKYNPKTAIAVTTQALRVANNKDDVISKIKQDTNIEFKIIDGQKEADLTLLAIKYALKRENIANEEFVLLDIGGGSSELSLVSRKKVIAKSFPFGIVTLTQSQNQEGDFEKFEDEINEFLRDSKFEISNMPFISTAGTPTTICAVKLGMNYETYDKQKINGQKLYLSDIYRVQQELLDMSIEDLQRTVGNGRTAYINIGIEIFKLFFKILHKQYSIVFDDGLREGVAINHCLKKM